LADQVSAQLHRSKEVLHGPSSPSVPSLQGSTDLPNGQPIHSDELCNDHNPDINASLRGSIGMPNGHLTSDVASGTAPHLGCDTSLQGSLQLPYGHAADNWCATTTPPDINAPNLAISPHLTTGQQIAPLQAGGINGATIQSPTTLHP